MMDHQNSFANLNLGYITELYDRYLEDPATVDPGTREIFRNWTPPEETFETPEKPPLTPFDVEKIVSVANLAQAIRSYGHLAAHLDPLGSTPSGDPSLMPATYAIDETEMAQFPALLVGGPIAERSKDALQAINDLRKVYSSTTGFDYGHIRVPEERQWLRESAEARIFRPPAFGIDLVRLLDRLTRAEAFEQFFNRFFPGKTRFSIEGLDMLVPMLDEVIRQSVESGICMAIIGMGHRGRLNILAHILAKPYAQIMAEFKDPGNDYTAIHGTSWTGDVKYHKGANRAIKGEEEVQIVIILPPNPSHLELINPIISGMNRAAQSAVDTPGSPRLYPDASLPIQIHGDASFPAEGIVAETLNLSRLPGYQTSGTIHIITNNQLGYTTPAFQGRSTHYASDLAKGFEVPVIHVNADDPVACIEAVRTAFAYRMKFRKDFVVDLVGYRRYGHNEGDEPGFTQPLLYEMIGNHPTARKLLADRLVEQGTLSQDEPKKMLNEHEHELQVILENLNPEKEDLVPSQETLSADQHPMAMDTRISITAIRSLNEEILKVPEGFALNRKLRRPRKRWQEALDKVDEPGVEWAQAETLALASILAEGISVRMTGQDVERGTFSQRHAVLHPVEVGESYVPLQNIPQARAAFEIHNSPLSESSVMGFEYGYNLFDATRMVIWEAQYGDFFNNAQSIVDEFIASGKSKWELKSSLVLLLPHGYEGAGPNHSSARPERFLQLALDTNLRVTNCTTAAQYFHLLRMQAKLAAIDPKPLVVFTPKSLLRHSAVSSSLRELAEGAWKPVLDDPFVSSGRESVERLVICSGKLAVDLVDSEFRQDAINVAIIRLEQLSPFPTEQLRSVLKTYRHLKEVIWAQEEPENMGAWDYVQPRIIELLDSRLTLKYVGRSASPSPSEGSLSWHNLNQKNLIGQVFGATSPEQPSEKVLQRATNR